MLRRILRFIVKGLFKLLIDLRVEGLENLPAQGGSILAANHLSRLDSALVFVQITRPDLTGLVADKYQKMPFFRWLVNAVGGIWINRESADFNALRQACAYLQRGGLLGIAPEGTRSRSGALNAAKTGVAYLAARSEAPIIPIAIWGSEKVFRELKRLRRPQVHVRFGAPFRLPPLPPGERAAGLQRNTDEIMCRIAAMLPPAYRGVYAAHPRLQELLAAAAA